MGRRIDRAAARGCRVSARSGGAPWGRASLPGPRPPRRGPHRGTGQRAVPPPAGAARATDSTALRRPGEAGPAPVPPADRGEPDPGRSWDGHPRQRPHPLRPGGPLRCLLGAKSDAQVICVDPALEHDGVHLVTDAHVRAWRPTPRAARSSAQQSGPGPRLRYHTAFTIDTAPTRDVSDEGLADVGGGVGPHPSRRRGQPARGHGRDPDCAAAEHATHPGAPRSGPRTPLKA